MSYAGFWKRFAAVIIDSILISVVLSVLGFHGYHSYGYGGSNFHAMSAGGLPQLILGWLYYSLMESSKHQATLGKMALGIKVTDLAGVRIDFARASGRYFGKILSGLILCIGFIMVAFTEKKQGLHDILAKTLVVNK